MKFTSSDDNDPLRAGIYLLCISMSIDFVLKGLRRPSNPLAKPNIQQR